MFQKFGINFSQSNIEDFEKYDSFEYVNLKTHAIFSFNMFTYSKEMKRQNVHCFKSLAIDFKIGKEYAIQTNPMHPS